MYALADVVAIAAGNILVGQDLCRRDEWINGSKKYVQAAIVAGSTLSSWSWFLRPFVYLRMPEMQDLKRATKAMDHVLQPVLEERRRRANQPGWEQDKPDDFMQWYMDHSMEFDLPMAEVMLSMGLVSLNTTTATTLQA